MGPFNGSFTKETIIENNIEIERIRYTPNDNYKGSDFIFFKLQSSNVQNVNNHISKEGYVKFIIFESEPVSNIITPIDTGDDTDNKIIECLNIVSSINIANTFFGKLYLFNDNISTYNQNIIYGLYDGIYRINNIPKEYPLAILNKNKETLITYSRVENSKNPIIIKVSGGSETPNEEGDYFNFHDENDNKINIANGEFRFMRGVSYRFIDYGIKSTTPFTVYANNLSLLSNYSNSFLKGDNVLSDTFVSKSKISQTSSYFFDNRISFSFDT